MEKMTTAVGSLGHLRLLGRRWGMGPCSGADGERQTLTGACHYCVTCNIVM
ncbi:hypothetical protein GCM10010104_50810 [Streptomyces indiaensis]|uniref:Uncharacterized protein n=1 Tax=Streptomyces indiaensis TaxID=284033 RepID=A0ABN3E4C5_9ACTN